MAKSNRQKYNFLVALTSQLEEALDDDTEEGAAFVSLLRDCLGSGSESDLEPRLTAAEDRCGKLEQWSAQFESALESLESSIGEDTGEDDILDDGSDDDDDVAVVRPAMAGNARRQARGTELVGDPLRPLNTVEEVGPRKRVVRKTNA